MEIIHGNIGIHCFDVFIEHNIIRLLSIVEIVIAFEIHTLYLCLLNVIRLKKSAILQLDEKVKTMYYV